MKKSFSKVSQMMLAVAAFVITFAGARVTANADFKGNISYLVQTGETTNSITVSWDAPKVNDNTAVTGFVIGIGANSDASYDMMNTAPIKAGADTTSYTFEGLNPGTKYNVYVGYTSKQKYYNSKTGSYEWENSKNIGPVGHGDIRTAPGSVTGLNQSKWWRQAKEVDVTWDEQDAVDGYEYIFSEADGKKLDSGSVDSAKYSHKINNNTIYKISVRAYSNINGRAYYSDWTPESYLMIQPSRADNDSIVNAKIKGGKMTVSWKKLKGASGYNVYVSTKPHSGYKKIKSVKANKSSVTAKFGKKKFNSKKTYYIYVQAYKSVSGVKTTTGVNYITVYKKGKLSCLYAKSTGDYE